MVQERGQCLAGGGRAIKAGWKLHQHGSKLGFQECGGIQEGRHQRFARRQVQASLVRDGARHFQGEHESCWSAVMPALHGALAGDGVEGEEGEDGFDDQDAEVTEEAASDEDVVEADYEIVDEEK